MPYQLSRPIQVRIKPYMLLVSLLLTISSTSCEEGSVTYSSQPPFVKGLTLIDGIVSEMEDGSQVKDVYGCCSKIDVHMSDSKKNVRIEKEQDANTFSLSPAIIGSMPQFTTEQTMTVLDSAKKAWNGGAGTWPQMSLAGRIDALEKFFLKLADKREEIVNILMWEIGKNRKDAEAEFDRTVSFAEQTIAAIKSPSNNEFNSDWETIGKTRAFVRRAAIGIILCLGPFNYPLNETYATLIPALLMGNVVIMKIPTIGGLAHLLAMEAFAEALPSGVVNFVSGSGRETMPPLMKTASIDGLAFIGGSAAADSLIKSHPEPHRLKLFLQLEAKNMAIFLPDLFEEGNKHALDRAISETITGSLSYNGQRCTALKIIFVPREHSKAFSKVFAAKVDSLRVGLPWQTWEEECDAPKVNSKKTKKYANITPLPGMKRVAYMNKLISDATSKGASIVNTNGGSILGGETESTLMIPAVLYPVDATMDIYEEEQFGPVVPIAPYDDIDTILKYGREGKYGQQCSIFTTQGHGSAATILDHFSSVFGKININSQCGRSPDTLPFSGRRSSALGVMSVMDALKEFSIPTVVTYKEDGFSSGVVEDISEDAQFMQPLD